MMTKEYIYDYLLKNKHSVKTIIDNKSYELNSNGNGMIIINGFNNANNTIEGYKELFFSDDAIINKLTACIRVIKIDSVINDTTSSSSPDSSGSPQERGL